MTALLRVPPFELARLWGELVEAYHGVNGFGGNTAEIYAYRFRIAGVKPLEMTLEQQCLTAQALHDLIELFIEEFPSRVRVNGHPFGEWVKNEPLNHRAAVMVVAT
jgi:hypothetical protein